METGEGAGWNRGRSCLPPQTPAAPACRGLSVHDSCLSPAIRVREWRFLIQASRGGTWGDRSVRIPGKCACERLTMNEWIEWERART
jgi:hypothetical protein